MVRLFRKFFRRRPRFSGFLAYEELRTILGEPKARLEPPPPSGGVLGMRAPSIFWNCGCQAGVGHRLRSGEDLYWGKPCFRHWLVLHGEVEPFLVLADIAGIDAPLPAAGDDAAADCVSLLRSVNRIYPTEVPRIFAEPIGELNGATLRELVERGDYRLAERHLVRMMERSPELVALPRRN